MAGNISPTGGSFAPIISKTAQQSALKSYTENRSLGDPRKNWNIYVADVFPLLFEPTNIDVWGSRSMCTSFKRLKFLIWKE